VMKIFSVLLTFARCSLLLHNNQHHKTARA
jgi:hypothetical protein